MESRSESKTGSNPRSVRRPTAVRARVAPARKVRLESGRDVSEDGSSSASGFSWGRSAVDARSLDSRSRRNGVKPVKIVTEGHGEAEVVPSLPLELVISKRRCTWITAYSEPIYISFHDEEWGVPVYDDQRLFELLVLSAALSEFSWSTILNKRDKFRNLLDNFDPVSVSKFTEKKILSLRSSGIVLSEQKLRAVVENARHMLKVIDEFGSFSNYCWSFVNHKPIINGFRYARQVPVKSPKAEIISKDLMRRGFRCVGPTIIYSFMQAAGMVNDHLSSCFRFRDFRASCCSQLKINANATSLGKSLNQAFVLQA
ncbi:hypothetical protein Cni_G25726 [Canna indica]|uniref:DNA-3-methyladenine glycosylase I n=1 Tax=Canna indica TaxID=4628 RepID=A0AAQ3KXJ1_9LILI|nr:hypothetical protein Cni_G25726 [Canna indica]